MSISRRNFVFAAAAAPAAISAASRPAVAAGQGASSGAALYDAPLGRYRITAILDGFVPLPRAFFSSPEEGVIDAVLGETGADAEFLPTPVNGYLLTSEDRTILVDAGMGALDALGPGLGRHSAGLAAAGVSPEQVDTVIVTHLHPDHVGGLLNDSAPAFPNAEIVVAEVEAGFWTDAAMQAAAPEEAAWLFEVAQNVVAGYGSQVTLVASGAEVAPGVSLTLSPGHTPGHSVLRIDGGARQLMMIGDTIHNTDLHTLHPDVTFGFDVDAALAAASRAGIFDMVSADKMLVAGSHIHFPGFGRVLRQGDGFRFAPATWS